MDSQFKKGVLPTCVLALLKAKDCYGYELVSSISEAVEVSEGTIYPLLRRLKNDKLVETYLQESSSGPPRKYYRLTTSGEKKAQQLIKDWSTFSKQIDKILKVRS